MTELRYCGLSMSPPVQTVTTVGSLPGPGGGDGWTQLAALPQSDMPVGVGHFVVHVRGKIGNRSLVGSGALRGIIQLCLGTTAGLRHQMMQTSHPVIFALPADEGVVFDFLLHLHSANPDSQMGSSFNPAVSQLCLWARTYRNGDAPTYAVQFDVCDVSWLWWDVGVIPAGHWVSDVLDSTFTLAGPAMPAALTRTVPTVIGDTGQRWLHFAAVRYQTMVGQTTLPFEPAPRFQFGITPDGTAGAFVTKVGSEGHWGMRRHQDLPVEPDEKTQSHHGCIWQTVIGNNTTKAGYRVWAPGPNGPGVDRLHRWSYFAVRIDTLTDLLVREDAGPSAVGARAAADWEQYRLLIERPAAGLLTHPIVIAHSVPTWTGQLAGCGARFFQDDGSNRWLGESLLPQADPFMGEAVSAIAFGRRVYQTTSAAMQWKSSLAGSSTYPAVAPQRMYDHCFVAFHPVRDPENVTVPPGTRPPAIVLYPGRQSADPVDLQPPPKKYTAELVRRGEPLRGEINAPLGYRKRWPLGGKPTAFYAVSWPAMVPADADAVMQFLRANPAWRLRTPAGVDVAALNMSPPQLEPLGGDPKLARVSVDVAVLIWTGL